MDEAISARFVTEFVRLIAASSQSLINMVIEAVDMVEQAFARAVAAVRRFLGALPRNPSSMSVVAGRDRPLCEDSKSRSLFFYNRV